MPLLVHLQHLIERLEVIKVLRQLELLCMLGIDRRQEGVHQAPQADDAQSEEEPRLDAREPDRSALAELLHPLGEPGFPPAEVERDARGDGRVRLGAVSVRGAARGGERLVVGRGRRARDGGARARGWQSDSAKGLRSRTAPRRAFPGKRVALVRFDINHERRTGRPVMLGDVLEGGGRGRPTSAERAPAVESLERVHAPKTQVVHFVPR